MDKEISLSKKIGLVIKRYRECKGLSQEIVSGFAGISRSNLANIERGRYDSISITKLKKVADALEVPLANIIAEAEY